jgi:hypothetical protein
MGYRTKRLTLVDHTRIVDLLTELSPSCRLQTTRAAVI